MRGPRDLQLHAGDIDGGAVAFHYDDSAGRDVIQLAILFGIETDGRVFRHAHVLVENGAAHAFREQQRAAEDVDERLADIQRRLRLPSRRDALPRGARDADAQAGRRRGAWLCVCVVLNNTSGFLFLARSRLRRGAPQPAAAGFEAAPSA